MMLLAPIPWIGRVWALPFFTVLAPSEGYHAERQERHKKLTDWARQMILQVRRWLPERQLVVVADGGYAVLELLAACVRLANPVIMVTRLRLDAALYDPAPPRQKGAKGRPRKKGHRQPTLAARLADAATDWQLLPGGLVWWRHPRGGVGQWHRRLVPHRLARRADPLGADPRSAGPVRSPSAALHGSGGDARTDRGLVCPALASRSHLRRSPAAIWASRPSASGLIWRSLRTTPVLLSLFSLVALLVHRLLQGENLPIRQAAWYQKATPSFSDALAFLRLQLWPARVMWRSTSEPDMVETPRGLLDCLIDTLAYGP